MERPVTELVYYNEEKDNIYIIDNKYRVWFADDLFWKIKSLKGNRPRLIKSLEEIKEKMNETGCEYLGDL
jgi:hypothetical protein